MVGAEFVCNSFGIQAEASARRRRHGATAARGLAPSLMTETEARLYTFSIERAVVIQMPASCQS